MQQALEVMGFGVVDAAVLAVAAIAFTLQFGVTNYFNFGYSEWLTFGAFIALTVNNGLLHVNVWLAMFIGGVATAILSLLINRAVFAPFTRRRPEAFYILIVTFGVGFLLNQLYILIWGTAYRNLNSPASPLHDVGPLKFSTEQLLFLLIAVTFMAGTYLILNHTRAGRCMRAMSDNRALAAICGFKTERITDLTWLMTGFMAGVAGVILAIETHTFGTDLGQSYVYLVFPAVIIGGIGRTYGALIGGLLIGLFTGIGVLVIPSAISPLVIFAALVAIVLLRPQGLVGGSVGGRMEEGQAL
ncbi:MAG TPA: branched-chain amino acid ABC transporter permease [Chloroflexota bacterium]|nr:branched-chain amino acid ABC transporter permease [Chloroflexota bacterium]